VPDCQSNGAHFQLPYLIQEALVKMEINDFALSTPQHPKLGSERRGHAIKCFVFMGKW
jgi:hypothetical protein